MRDLCEWCGVWEDVTQHAPGHEHEPETQARHRFRPPKDTDDRRDATPDQDEGAQATPAA